MIRILNTIHIFSPITILRLDGVSLSSNNLLFSVLSALQIRKMETSQKFLDANERGEGRQGESCMVTMMVACSINGESINADTKDRI